MHFDEKSFRDSAQKSKGPVRDICAYFFTVFLAFRSIVWYHYKCQGERDTVSRGSVVEPPQGVVRRT